MGLTHKTPRSILILLAAASTYCVTSCQKADMEDAMGSNASSAAPTNGTELLVFSSPEQLEQTIAQGQKRDSRGRALTKSAEYIEQPGLRSINQSDSTGQLSYDALVPEKSFRDLLNTRGEIQVGDSVYCIVPAGTFYAHKNHLEELRHVAQSYRPGEGQQIGPNRYRIGNISLFETFANAVFTEDDLEAKNDEQPEATSRARSAGERYWGQEIPAPEIEKFPQERGSRVTFFGRLFQGFSFRKSHTATFPSDGSRRLNCAVYDYNYVLRHSIGVTAKVQKKMWYGGWGVVRGWNAKTLAVGFKYALVKYPYPDGMFGRIESALGLVNRAKTPYEPISGSAYADRLPYPSWFRTTLIYATEPMIALGLSNVTLRDVVAFAGDQAKRFINSNLTDLWEEQQKAAHQSYLGPKLSQDELSKKIQELRATDFLPAAVPIYAQDGIYILYTGGCIYNRYDSVTEIDFKFDDGFGPFMIGWNGNLKDLLNINLKRPWGSLGGRISFGNPAAPISGVRGDLGNISLEIQAEKKRGTLVSGEFYAAAYNERDWVGYNLYW